MVATTGTSIVMIFLRDMRKKKVPWRLEGGGGGGGGRKKTFSEGELCW